LQVALFAKEEFRARLQHPRFRNLVNRAAMFLDPGEPLLRRDGGDAAPPLAVAGGKSFPFTDQAIEQIYAYSQRIPRTQVILADNALLAAFTRWSRTEGDCPSVGAAIRVGVQKPDIEALPSQCRGKDGGDRRFPASALTVCNRKDRHLLILRGPKDATRLRITSILIYEHT
jgi:hypothetical protein